MECKEKRFNLIIFFVCINASEFRKEKSIHRFRKNNYNENADHQRQRKDPKGIRE